MPLDSDDQPLRIIVDKRDQNNIIVQEQITHIDISQGGPQGIQGPQGLIGPAGPSGKYTISETAPTEDLQSGDLWFRSSTAQLYFYYDSYWVETSTSYLGPTGPAGATGATGPAGPGANLTSVTTDILPSVDNTYVLGNQTHRWKSISVGQGTIYITDAVTANTASLTISNGIFFINGIAQAQLPNVKLTNLTFNDNTIQTTAYVPGTIAIRTPAMGNTLTVNLATDTYVHQHVNNGNLSITLTNPTAGRTVELLLMWGNTSGGSISINGISGSNISNGSNGFAITKQFNSIRLYCIDNNFTETFAVVSIS
jgi:hypothetical protein